MRLSYGSGPVARFSRDLRDLSWLYLTQGASLVLLGILIVLFPELLAILVATFLIVVGVLTLATGWRLRRARRAFDEMGRLLWD
ncbi:MAG: DUF3096 domain-containing protein [Anaerolineae bacterium]|nr:DUF3096 domain-containing protein [Anaerolineae bacterium]